MNQRRRLNLFWPTFSGTWSEQAAEEASKSGTVHKVLPEGPVDGIPDQSTWKLDPEASYLYYCDNETIQGKEIVWYKICGLCLWEQELPTLWQSNQFIIISYN